MQNDIQYTFFKWDKLPIADGYAREARDGSRKRTFDATRFNTALRRAADCLLGESKPS